MTVDHNKRLFRNHFFRFSQQFSNSFSLMLSAEGDSTIEITNLKRLQKRHVQDSSSSVETRLLRWSARYELLLWKETWGGGSETLSFGKSCFWYLFQTNKNRFCWSVSPLGTTFFSKFIGKTFGNKYKSSKKAFRTESNWMEGNQWNVFRFLKIEASVKEIALKISACLSLFCLYISLRLLNWFLRWKKTPRHS